MFKKLLLSLVLVSVVSQPLMAVDLDTAKLATCMQSAKVLDPQMFVKCIEESKIPELSGYAKTADFVSKNAFGLTVGALALSAAFFYLVVWPDVAIESGFSIRYQKNSHAELHAARR